MKAIRLLFLIWITASVAACSGLGQTPPPPPHSPESLATALKLTENAPPPGLDRAAFDVVDAELDEIDGYRYVLEVRFEGVFDDTLEATSGFVRTEVWWDGIAPARRVVLDADGALFASEPRDLEGVRIGDDYYLVDETGRCLLNVDDTARAVASLRVGSLLGGMAETSYAGIQAVLNGQQAYRFDLTPETVSLPLIHRNDDSVVQLAGELWVMPEPYLVNRLYANVDVSRVTLLEGTRSVSGQVFVRYDVYDIGVVPNISIPYGC